MSAALAGLIPVFLIIAAGWLTRASGLIPRENWAPITKLAYWVMFPAMLFTLISRIDFESLGAGAFVAATALGFAAMGVIALAMRLLMRGVDGPAYSSFFQGSVRWNGFVLLAAAPFVFGPEGETLAALVFAPTVPLVNVMCVGVLSVWGAHGGPSPGQFALRFVTNPLIIASVSGAVWALFGLPSEGVVFDALEIIGRAGLATALLGVGAGIDITKLRARPRLLAIAVAMKMMVMPVVLWLAAQLFGLEPLATAVLVAAGGVPGAASAYVLARELGGDAELVAGHVTATTLVSLIILPIVIALTAPA